MPFLGVNFQGTHPPEGQSHCVITIHDRSCRRALDRVIAMTDHAVNPALVQQYLKRWAQWWVRSTHRQLSYPTLISAWMAFAKANASEYAYAAEGLPQGCAEGEGIAKDDLSSLS